MSIVEINVYTTPEELVRLHPSLDDIKAEIAAHLVKAEAVADESHVNIHVHSSVSSF